MRIHSLGAVSLAVLLGACQSPFNGGSSAWSEQSAHPITVETQLVSQQFPVGPDAFTLRQDDRDRIAGIAADYRGRGTGKLSIAAPQGSPNAAVAVQIAAEMTQIAQEQGIRARDVEIAGYHAPGGQADAPVIVSYTVYRASPSDCGNWTQNYAFAPLNRLTPDHGCSTQNNLAAMVEDPRDLVTPRNEDTADNNRRAAVLGHYRKGEITASQKDDQAAGAVSEVKQ